ncbi:hypothetical protein SAMN05660420_01416 [Desulfuromusa kysingii]|uniref:DUF2062 domain-containing protein n=2 Tax=Desulfuromusa kysingii TaxID=37625 RepID=A0A1H3YWF8_9BACT|nr:hypothetical protein SAMN05660420_01416 [Desulfuromusa kysingii]
MWRRWGFFRQFKLNVIQLARLRSEPDAIARGMALGLFIGFTPTFGVQIFLAILFAFLLRQNKIAAFIGVWITNPFTAPIIYGLEYEIGRMLLGMPPLGMNHFAGELSWSMGMSVGTPLLLGSLVLGVPVAIIGYSVTVRLIPSLRLWKIPRWPRRRNKSL